MLQCMFVLHFQDLEVLISMVIVMLLLNLACQRKSASHLCQMVCSLSNMQCNFNFAIPSVTTDKCISYSILDYIKYQSMICSLFWVNTNSAFWYMRSVLDPLPVITVSWCYWLEMIEYFFVHSKCLFGIKVELQVEIEFVDCSPGAELEAGWGGWVRWLSIPISDKQNLKQLLKNIVIIMANAVDRYLWHC